MADSLHGIAIPKGVQQALDGKRSECLERFNAIKPTKMDFTADRVQRSVHLTEIIVVSRQKLELEFLGGQDSIIKFFIVNLFKAII
ncbi:hypothetical protein CHS0354_029155, partial [Potamilus streckersoni]